MIFFCLNKTFETALELCGFTTSDLFKFNEVYEINLIPLYLQHSFLNTLHLTSMQSSRHLKICFKQFLFMKYFFFLIYIFSQCLFLGSVKCVFFLLLLFKSINYYTLMNIHARIYFKNFCTSAFI